MKKRILFFPDSSLTPDILDVGEKGLSLFNLSSIGLEVPEGFILTSSFFQPWIDSIEASSEWQEFAALAPEKMWGNISITEKIPELVLTEEQGKILHEALSKLPAPLLALRPSLADPIIHGSSFADRYETHLAVAPDQIAPLLGRVFRSCIDPRIYMIQKKRGLETPRIRIAMIIQTQVFSEASGSIYSAHPQTNDYDEAMVESVWGMGDYLADGAVEPDRYTMNKVDGSTKESVLGSKRVTSWLNFQKVVERRPDWKHNQLSLTPEQLKNVFECMKKAEALYSTPVKLDWAMASGKIYALQASSFSSTIRVPPKYQTAPHEKRHVYLNLTSVFFGLRRPLSIVSTDFYTRCIQSCVKRLVGSDLMAEYWSRVVTCWNGAIFLDVTILLAHLDRKTVLKIISKFDPLAAKKIEQLIIEEPLQTTSNVPWNLFSISIRILARNPALVVKIIGAILFPEIAYGGMKREAKRLKRYLQNRSLEKMSLESATESLVKLFSKSISRTFLPAFAASVLARQYLRNTFATHAASHWKMREYLRCLTLYHPHIGSRILPLELHYLSRLVQVEQIKSEEDLIQQLHHENVPPSYKQAWRRFLERFGAKGPEMADLNAPRFAEESLVLLPTIFHLLNAKSPHLSPQEIFERTDSFRQRLPGALVERAAVQFWPEIFPVRRAARISSLLSCGKEWCESSLHEMTHLIRLRLLEAGSHFATHNRLENREQIFNLSLSQIDYAHSHPKVALRSMLVQAEVTNSLVPHLIDSRGRVLLDSLSLERNETGSCIVPGKVRGKARFMESYRPQDFQPGEILVVSCLDSAWSPIVVLAKALIVEYGGEWNPGVRMAMEYHIPCISGLPGATSQIQTGEWIEVDAENGTFRKIAPPATA